MTTAPSSAPISERETKQINAANASGRPPVVFVHGLWLLPSSWDRWAQLFEQAGYAPVAASWPDDPDTVEEARAKPEVLAKKTVGQVVDQVVAVIEKLDRKPAVVGHSFGGLFTQMIAGRGLSAVSVAIDPVQFRGVLPLPIATLRSAIPVLGNPLNRGRAVSLSWDQFRYGWANALSVEEGKQLHEAFHVPGSGTPIFQAAMANLNPWTEVKVETKNPDRGPLLLISGEQDHTIPPVLVNAAHRRQKRNEGVTEIEKVPRRGHTLTIDGGWREVADKALAFVRRFVSPEGTKSAEKGHATAR
jgi:non-heme chloroperoxidase